MTVRRKIFLLSCFAHVFFFAFFLVYKKQNKPLEKKIIVKNYTIAPKPPVLVQNKTPKPKTKKVPKPVIKAKKSKPKAKKPAKPKKIAVKKTHKKKPRTAPLPDPTILSDLKEALANLEAKPLLKKTSNSSLNIPKTVQRHQIETISSTVIAKSFDTQTLITYLEDNLELPEKGAVKIEIHLEKNGTFKNLIVLDSESKKNEKYLKNRLPQLSFPCLNTGDQTEIPLNFTIYFKNL